MKDEHTGEGGMMGWGVDGKGTEFPTKMFDYEAARASLAEEKPQAALCVHEWEREPQNVVVTSWREDTNIERGVAVADQKVGKAFPCRKCGSLLVLQERQG